MSRAAELPSRFTCTRAPATGGSSAACAQQRRDVCDVAHDATQQTPTSRHATRHIAAPGERRPSRPRACTGPQWRCAAAARDTPGDATAAIHAAPRTRRRCVRWEGAVRAERGDDGQNGEREAARTRAAGSLRARGVPTLREPPRAACRPALDTPPGVSPVLRVASDAAPARGGGEELTPPNRAQGRTDEDKRRAIDTAAAGRLLGCGGESHQTTRSTRACAPAARASPVAMRAGEGSLRATRRPRTRQQ
jgi:hypothetical protein